ncbi:MAG: type IV toxin-antitoxin system AbiEi family antitoxin domain-containing protein [Deltaproteobacteria bacterium]|nr:type IV toxin-antitoxin system AbiEi family antitoxin domain-containing protein [Deltaproteobacteria bacterium]
MTTSGPSWDHLYERAVAQAGYFSTAQAAEAGYSPPLLHKYLQNGRIIRIRRGVYRLVHFPSGDDEDLVVHWLWSNQEGVFSHETALARHELSDLLPQDFEMTVPAAWRRRRLRVPDGLRLHYADLPDEDRAWHGPVPITTPARTVNDCARAGVSPEFLEQAFQQGLERGLFDEDEVDAARRAVVASEGC